jgi:kinetochore protein NDC80
VKAQPAVKTTNTDQTNRYEQLVLQANALREELHTEIDRMLNDVIKFKIHVQKNLDDYEGFVADELEKELGSDEMGEETRQMDM